MVVTNYGRSGNTLMWVGSANAPQWAAIGSGSGADVASLGSLIAEVGATRVAYTDRNIATNQEVAFTFDFNSVTMSGVNLREFAIAGSQLKGVNDCWLREAFDAIVFDGTNELQLQITLKTV